ncbi:MAG: hypothetical protein ABUL60_22555 [Myxococcales bacterium]
MSGLRLVGGGVLSVVLLLSCGGTTTDSPAPAPSEVPVGGASGDASECSGGAPDGGCDGRGGEAALEAYARLRTACSLTVRVNRRGAPVCIDYHLK